MLARRLAIQVIHQQASDQVSRVEAAQQLCRVQATERGMRRMLAAIRVGSAVVQGRVLSAQDVVVHELCLLPQVQAYFDGRARDAIDEIARVTAARVAVFDFGGAW